MLWYNILGDNKEIIPHPLHLDTITVGSVLLTSDLVALKRENTEPILTVKRTGWRKLIDYLGLSIEADPPKVGKKNAHFVYIGSIPSNSSVNHHTARKYLDKKFNLEPPKLRLYQLTENLAANIVPHISYDLIDLGVIFDKYILSRSNILAVLDCEGDAE